MYFKKETGNNGENLACDYLIKKGYTVIEQNFSCKQGEIDIIAKSPSNYIVFIEVKTRKSLKYGMPSEAVTPYKQKHIMLSAKYYIFKNNIYNIDIRFDVIEILKLKNKIYIHQIKNAFEQ